MCGDVWWWRWWCEGRKKGKQSNRRELAFSDSVLNKFERRERKEREDYKKTGKGDMGNGKGYGEKTSSKSRTTQAVQRISLLALPRAVGSRSCGGASARVRSLTSFALRILPAVHSWWSVRNRSHLHQYGGTRRDSLKKGYTCWRSEISIH